MSQNEVNTMLDIHTHILPEMDDGAKDKEEAAALITLLKNQGVTIAVLTPHYYPFEEKLPDFVERRLKSYESISDSGFNMIPASETYLSESLFSNDSIDELTIANTRYLLLELPYFERWGADSVYRQISRMISKYNIRPVIAHADRYECITGKKGMAIQKLTDLGCLIQINIDSVIDRETRPLMIKLIKEGWVDFVGSDCHNLLERPPRFDLFNKIMRKKLHTDYKEEWHL